MVLPRELCSAITESRSMFLRRFAAAPGDTVASAEERERVKQAVKSLGY